MGKRSRLFNSARNCINILEVPKPTEDLYEENFPLCVIFCTRWKLIKVANSIITSLEKYSRADRNDLIRFYKLNSLVMYQTQKYSTNQDGLDSLIDYLGKISYMITKCSKSNI